MTIREELLEAIEGMADEDLTAIFDYVRFLKEPEEIEPTEEERIAISKGREEYAKGEYLKWQEIKNHASL